VPNWRQRWLSDKKSSQTPIMHGLYPNPIGCASDSAGRLAPDAHRLSPRSASLARSSKSSILLCSHNSADYEMVLMLVLARLAQLELQFSSP